MPNSPDKVWATLDDGTPLVTARREGKGLIVLFHVTANADWSNLPLTGLFVDMLRRVLDLAPAAGGGAAVATAQADAQAFTPWRALDGFGDLTDPLPDVQPIPAAAIDKARASAATPAGLYRRGAQERALNITRSGDALDSHRRIAGRPSPSARSTPHAGNGRSRHSSSPSPPCCSCSIALPRCSSAAASTACACSAGQRRQHSAVAAGAAACSGANAQSTDDFALQNALQTRLAYVITGDSAIDDISQKGLTGLNLVLRDRTSVDPGDPVGINIERDDLTFFPMLYWPVRADAAVPSDAALARIDTYMKNGGTIFFDLREDGAGIDALTGGATAAGEALRRMLAKLDIPPLEPVPETHVLTKQLLSARPLPRPLCRWQALGRAHRCQRATQRQQRRRQHHHHRLQRLCRRLGHG